MSVVKAVVVQKMLPHIEWREQKHGVCVQGAPPTPSLLYTETVIHRQRTPGNFNLNGRSTLKANPSAMGLLYQRPLRWGVDSLDIDQ